MEKLKVDYKFNLEDFKIMENIEHSYFPNDNITPAEEVLNWYEKNNLTCIGVRNEKGIVIASVNIIPLKKETFFKIYENKMNEADVTYEEIEEYEEGKTYFMYLSSISIDNKYRNNYKVITNLLKGCMELFDILEKRNIKIEKVMADASTIHGEKICKKLLKMKYITNTNHDSKIFAEEGQVFIKNIKKLKKKFNK